MAFLSSPLRANEVTTMMGILAVSGSPRIRRLAGFAGEGLQEAIGLTGEKVSDDLSVELVVLHEEDPLLAHVPSVTSAMRRGIAKWKVEPRPGSLSTQTCPPWSSTNVLVMLNPSPVPPNSRLMLASTWRNSPKM